MSERDYAIIAIDERYLVVDGREYRLAVSYGPNITKRFGGPSSAFPRPPRLDGDAVFGIHSVHTSPEDEVNVVDQSYDFKECNVSGPEEIAKKAAEILAGIGDEKYKSDCEFAGKVGDFGRRPIKRWKMGESS